MIMLLMALLAVGRRFGGSREPGFVELLSDPLVRALMEADRIDPEVAESELRRMAQRLSVMQQSADG
jgi:hypothetical protein